MSKRKVIIGLAIIPILLLGYLAFQGLENSIAYYYTIAEAAAMEGVNERIRIKGDLIKDSMDYQPELPLLTFTITDGENKLAMSYADVLPDNFAHADEVIVEGQFNQEREFIVSKLMLQCPSKYEEGE